MTKYSKPSKTIFSAETEKIVKDIVLRVEKFKAEVNTILSKYERLPVEGVHQLIVNTFLKFHLVVGEIKKRHEHRHTLEITDEYDVQDLLRGLLRLYFNDIRDEEWTPSYAGKCTRIDFLLTQEKIAIETKMTREGLDAKKIGEELIVDIAHYQKHPLCKKLYCLVYDPEERISNPNGLIRDLSGWHNELYSEVYIVPKRA